MLSQSQRDTLRQWSFIEHLGENEPYYRAITTVLEGISANLSVPVTLDDYRRILREKLSDDPILGKYIDSRQYIGDDTRLGFVNMFVELLVSDLLEGTVGEIEERSGRF